jgi:hypothetical protein
MGRSIAVLKLSPRIKNVITFAQSVASALTDNASFPSPNPPLATLQANITALSTAETAVLARTKGAVEDRNAKLATLRTDLETLKAYVQGVADAANPTNAASIIESAGMTVRTITLHDKPALGVKQGSVSGTVNLAAKAPAHRASYAWQYSTDQKTWTSVPQTLQAKTGVSGLTAGTTYYFRVQVLTMTGEGDWSQIVSLLVK